MAYYEHQYRVNVELLRSSQPGVGRVVRLNHAAHTVPPQLHGRVDPAAWAAFIGEVSLLASHHPYGAKPSAGQCCEWAACFALGSVVGLFCVNPDAGDYGAFNAEANALVARWHGYWQSVGASLSLSRGRDFWLQIDLDPNWVAVGMPAAPLPQPYDPPAKPTKV